jgi:hypothetical protein
MPGFEPGISRPQREVLTTILHTPGEAGYRSQYLSHAKRALYHLSYIPMPHIPSPSQIQTRFTPEHKQNNNTHNTHHNKHISHYPYILFPIKQSMPVNTCQQIHTNTNANNHLIHCHSHGNTDANANETIQNKQNKHNKHNKNKQKNMRTKDLHEGGRSNGENYFLFSFHYLLPIHSPLS